MVSLPLFVETNSKIALIIGGLINILLIILVRKKTPKEMKFYSKIVLQTCFCDLANLLVGDIVQPILIIYNGVVLAVDFGISNLLPFPWDKILFYVWLFYAYVAMFGVVVQFIYRYLVLCKEYKIETKLYLMMIGLIAFILIILLGFDIWITMSPDKTIVEEKNIQKLLLNGDDDFIFINGSASNIPPVLHVIFRSEKNDIPWLLWHLCFIAMCVGGYITIGTLGYKIVVFTQRNLDPKVSTEKRVVEMNKQLTLNIIVQACIPLTALFGWLLCTYTCILGSFISTPNSGLNYSSLFAFPVQNWISVFNPLATMIIVKPYRKALLKMMHLSFYTGGGNRPTNLVIPATNPPNTTNCEQPPL